MNMSYAMSRGQLIQATIVYPVMAVVGLIFGPIFLIVGLRDLLAGHVAGLWSASSESVACISLSG